MFTSVLLETHLVPTVLIPEKYQTSFETAKDAEDFAPFYGATLMAYLETPDYWLAFHIGDGKLVTLEQDVNGKLLFREPVPADEDCFLNKTTSLCDSNAFNEIRCCFGGRETHPLAVFLCSDGIEDSWGANLNLYSYYARFLKQLKTKTADEISNGLPIELAELSRRGSGDDMSLACLYDETQHDLLYRLILEWQIDAVQEQLQKLDSPNSTQPDFNSLEADIAAAKSVEDALEKKRSSISERIEEINRHRNVINNKIEKQKGELSTSQTSERSVYSDILAMFRNLLSSRNNELNQLIQDLDKTEIEYKKACQKTEKTRRELAYQKRKYQEKLDNIKQLTEMKESLEKELAELNPQLSKTASDSNTNKTVAAALPAIAAVPQQQSTISKPINNPYREEPVTTEHPKNQ